MYVCAKYILFFLFYSFKLHTLYYACYFFLACLFMRLNAYSVFFTYASRFVSSFCMFAYVLDNFAFYSE